MTSDGDNGRDGEVDKQLAADHRLSRDATAFHRRRLPPPPRPTPDSGSRSCLRVCGGKEARELLRRSSVTQGAGGRGARGPPGSGCGQRAMKGREGGRRQGTRQGMSQPVGEAHEGRRAARDATAVKGEPTRGGGERPRYGWG